MKYVIIGMLLCIGSLYPNQLQPSSPISKRISVEETDLQSVIEKLFAIGIIHSGSFTLKNGLLSPYYVDLRCAISYPQTAHSNE